MVSFIIVLTYILLSYQIYWIKLKIGLKLSFILMTMYYICYVFCMQNSPKTIWSQQIWVESDIVTFLDRSLWAHAQAQSCPLWYLWYLCNIFPLTPWVLGWLISLSYDELCHKQILENSFFFFFKNNNNIFQILKQDAWHC